MMASDTLASCPFCGWPDIAWRTEIYGYDWIEYAAHCGNCDAEGKACRSREEAAAAWNRRVPAAPAPTAQEELAEDIKSIMLRYLWSVEDGMDRRVDRVRAWLAAQPATQDTQGKEE